MADNLCVNANREMLRGYDLGEDLSLDHQSLATDLHEPVPAAQDRPT